MFLYNPTKTNSVSSSHCLHKCINTYNQVNLVEYRFMLGMNDGSIDDI
jgi:hypothetical protein